MSERPRRTEVDLDYALSDVGRRVAYPPTPDLASSVRARLSASLEWRTPWWKLLPLRWGLGLAGVAATLLAGGMLLLSPETRAAVADRLGLGGISITHVPSVPDPTATPIPDPSVSGSTPTPEPLGSDLGLGERLALPAAQARVSFSILLPSALGFGDPDAVYLGLPPPGGQVTLLYRSRSGLPPAAGAGLGLLLSQFLGDIEPGLLGKSLGPGTRLEAVTVNSAPGFWIEGQAHIFLYRDASGGTQEERVRLAGNVLLWKRGSLILRLESALGKAEAINVGASVR